MDARIVAIALALASLGLAVTFAIVMYNCGAMETSQSSPPQPTDGTHCVSVFHPFSPVWAAFAILGALGLWWRKAWPAIALGAVGTGLGVLAGFSAGFFGIGCGVLLLAAGLVGRRRRPHPLADAT
jgi:ABC-type phosphate/phosphonate transport system permease subunit